LAFLDATSSVQTQINGKFTLPSLTSGSILLSDGSTIVQDNANFFFDDTNNRFRVNNSLGLTAATTIVPSVNTDAGIIVRGAASQSGDLQTWQNSAGTTLARIEASGNMSLRHVIGITSAPTIAAGTGAGTTPTISISGTDLAGRINVRTGTTPAANGTIATVTFNSGYAVAPYCVMSPANAITARQALNSRPFNTSTTTTLVLTANTTAMTASTAYSFNYICAQ